MSGSAIRRKIADVLIGARYRLAVSGRAVKIESRIGAGWLARIEPSGLEVTVLLADLGEELDPAFVWQAPEDTKPAFTPRRRSQAPSPPTGLDWRQRASGEREDE